MASRSSSKNSRTSTVKKRTSPVRKSTARKTSKRAAGRKRKKPHRSKRGLLFFLLLFVMASLVAFGYYLGQNNRKPSPKAEKTTVSHPKKAGAEKPSAIFSSITPKEPRKEVKAPPAAPKTHKSVKREEKAEVVLAYRTEKPKLVIIIDDISNAKQLQQIKALNMAVTPSIFPPSKLSMQSHRLAKGLKHYMIHLPMESGNRQFNRQYKTLKVSFGRAQMEARIKEIRRLFPKARYINNHTGSVFTSNEKAMQMLYGIMRQEGFVFIDSRTSSATKVKKIAHAYGDAYVARDVFIDNTLTVSSIHRQLRKAVKIAGKKGYAIAIGHPHKETMRALASAGDMFQDVELVYIDTIYQKR